jgi:hypothetical protein
VQPEPGRVLRREIILALATCSVVASMALGTGAQAQGHIGSVVSAQMQVRPTSGPGGTQIDVRATGLPILDICERNLEFRDSAGRLRVLKSLPITVSFRTRATIPTSSALGLGTVQVGDARGSVCFPVTAASAGFTVTG